MKKSVIDILFESGVIDNKMTMVHTDVIKDITVNWPQISEPDAFDYGETENEEDLDLENWEILSIDDNKMVMCAGGDWQEPLMMTLVSHGDDQLYVLNTEEGYENGLSNEEIIKIIKREA